MKPFVTAAAEAKLKSLYSSGLTASYSFIPIGAVVGALEFRDFLYTAVLSVFGALIGFIVRLLLDHYYEKYKAEKLKLKSDKDAKDNERQNP